MQSVSLEFYETKRKNPLSAQIRHHIEAWRVISPYMGQFMLLNATYDPQKALKGGLFVSAVNFWLVANFHYKINIEQVVLAKVTTQ